MKHHVCMREHVRIHRSTCTLWSEAAVYSESETRCLRNLPQELVTVSGSDHTRKVSEAAGKDYQMLLADCVL